MTKRYGTKGIRRDGRTLEIEADEIYGACAREFGESGARYAADIAESDFTDFSRSMTLLGIPRIPSDSRENETARQRINGGRYTAPSRFSDMPLVMRYPFLCPHVIATSCSTGRENELATDSNDLKVENPVYYHMIPSGWAARFGLEICEDIRTILLGGDEENAEMDDILDFECYFVDDVKEKYGIFRWDGFCRNKDKSDDLMNLVDLYEALSEGTCCDCGSIQEVYTDRRGYPLPVCFSCRSLDKTSHSTRVEKVRTFLHEIEPAARNTYIPWELSNSIALYLIQQECYWSIVDLKQVSYGFFIPGKDERTVFPYKELQRKYPNLQIFRLADKYCKIEKTALVAIEDLRREISAAMSR